MVHELIGIQDNKVDLKSIGNLPKDQEVGYIFHWVIMWRCSNLRSVLIEKQSLCYSLSQEVVLSSEQDSFFKANMYENFGDIGMNIKRLVDEFQQVAKSNQNIQTIGWCLKLRTMSE